MQRTDALELARRAIDAARAAGAHAAEAALDADASIEVSLAKNDLDQVKVSEETTIGLRVIVDGRAGFATTNRTDDLAALAAEAVAVARSAPVDELATLAAPAPVPDAPDALHPSLEGVDAAALARMAMAHMRRVRAQDDRVVVDMGEFSLHRGARAVASTTGVAQAWRSASVGGDLFGMAVDAGTPGSFSYDGDRVRSLDDLEPALEQAFDRFVANCVGALSPQPGEAFRGPVLLPPWALGSFLLGPLLGAMSGRSVRQGRSPLAERVGEAVAASKVTLRDGGAGLGGFALAPFDREGQPRQARPLVDQGVLRGFLYDAREARAAGVPGTGSALGSASSTPSIGVAALELDAGDVPSSELLAGMARGVLVTRFSGSTDPISGDFSGVVKGGFLVRDGAKVPIHETTIAGNVWRCLEQVSALSSDRLTLYGTRRYPWVRVEDLSITAA